MFQPETLSRTEARSTSAKISKQLKIRGLFRPFFGTPPAAINSGSLKTHRENREGRYMKYLALVRVVKLSRRREEHNLELEEIWADDEQSRNTRTIRQTVPTNCSSTA
jgi:hypothetical protein